MTYRGHVSNGVVVLDDAVVLPEGINVTVEPAETTAPQISREGEMPSLYEELKPFIGMLEGLPPDASVNIDHYLYGLPKRE